MSRINTNVSSMLAQRVLGMQNKGLTGSLERLSTGLRISRGADDPAGLIASENLRSEKKAIGAAISNAQRARDLMFMQYPVWRVGRRVCPGPGIRPVRRR